MSWIKLRKGLLAQSAPTSASLPLGLPWYLQKNNIESIWQKYGKGLGSFITVYDTCVDITNPGIENSVVLYRACSSSSSNSRDLYKKHGTSVAGLIVANNTLYKTKNNNYLSASGEMRISGVIPDAKVLAVDKALALDINSEDPITFYTQLRNIAQEKLDANGFNIKLLIEQIFINYSENAYANMWTNAGQMHACKRFTDSKVLVTASIANVAQDLSNKGQSKYFPANLNSPLCTNNLLRVAATNDYSTQDIGKFLDVPYNKSYTDIYGPGGNISVLIPVTSSGYVAEYPQGGSSLSAPLVSATLGLMALCKLTTNPKRLREVLLENADTSYKALDNSPLLDINKAINAFCNTDGEGDNLFPYCNNADGGQCVGLSPPLAPT